MCSGNNFHCDCAESNADQLPLFVGNETSFHHEKNDDGYLGGEGKRRNGRHKSFWPTASGTMGALIRAHDWAKTPLGPIKTWPQSLHTVIDLMLASPQPVYMAWGPTLTALYNDAYVPILGAKHPDALGQRHADVWPEIMAEYGPAIDAVMAGQGQRFEDRPVVNTNRGGGPIGWFSFSLTPLRDETGRVVGFYATGNETTEKVRAEEKLRESEARFRCLVEGWAQAIWETNAEGAVLADSPSWRAYTGQTLAEALGFGWVEAIHPDDRADAMQQWREAVAARHGFDAVYRLRRATGDWRWANVRGVPLLADDGTVRKWIGMHIDITERREAEVRLHQTNTLLETLLESIPDPVFVKDTEGRFLLANEATSRLLGMDRDKVLGTRDCDYLPPAIVEQIEAIDRHVICTGEAVVVEEELPNLTSGEQRVYLTSKAPLWDAEGAIIGVVGIARDITERRRVEELTRAARDAAEEANRAKSRFLAAASHDLRQPMQSLLLFLEVLKPHVVPKGEGALKHLGRGLDALRDLLDSLLDVSRLDAGVVAVRIEDFAVAQMIEQIGAAYAPIAAAKGLTFQTCRCSAAVRSDRTLLGRMVRNLVENALRYTENGGIAITCQVADGRLRIEVCDTGIGIPPDHLDRVWEEFHQVGNPERDRNRGLGLGLSIVQRLSVLLEHPVDVRSAPGQGSVFSLAVPLGQAEPQQPTAGRVDKTASIGRLIVLVDDDVIVLLGLKAMFEEWGYEVLAACSIEQALDALKAAGRGPDMVIVDFRLREGRTGTEAILRVREAYGPDIPGIILTGETGTEPERDAAEYGLALIHKPVTPRQLSETLMRQAKVLEAAR